MRRLLVTVLLAGLSHGFFAPQKALEPGVPAAIKTRLSKLVPPASELGARPSGQLRFYSSDLYQYINGGAEAFHNYDMLAMVHQEYRAKDVELTVDIYDMGDPLNAFGVYSSERSPDYRFLAIGAESNISATTLNLLQGAFYVKLSALGPKEKTAQLLESFAKAISQRIGPDRSLPGFLSWFPEQRLIARSHKYVKRAPLGHDFLGPAYMASYRFGRQESLLVVSEASSVEDAKSRAQRLRSHFSQTGKVLTWPQVPGAYRGLNQLEGVCIFFPRSRYTVILANPPANPDMLLKDLLARIS